MLSWFDNPPRRKGKRKLYGAAAKAHAKAQRRKKGGRSRMAKKHRRKLYGAAAKAHAKRMRRGGGGHKRRRSSSRRSYSRPKARRRRHAITSRATATRAGRQLRYRRPNPPGLRGIIGQLKGGVIDAGWIVGGKAASRIIAGFIPITTGGKAVQTAVQIAAAVAAGYAGRFISPNASRMMLAGGLAGVIESFVKDLNVPYISAALSDSVFDTAGGVPAMVPGTAAYPAMSAYPGVSAYPGLMSGEDEEILYS